MLDTPHQFVYLQTGAPQLSLVPHSLSPFLQTHSQVHLKFHFKTEHLHFSSCFGVLSHIGVSPVLIHIYILYIYLSYFHGNFPLKKTIQRSLRVFSQRPALRGRVRELQARQAAGWHLARHRMGPDGVETEIYRSSDGVFMGFFSWDLVNYNISLT